MTDLNVPNHPIRYDHLGVEGKWRETWEREKTFSVDLDNAERPYYNLMMFPYPSAEGLHVGNFYAFTGSDINGRYHRAKGYDVFEPMGWDAFGIHSENYAHQVGSTPMQETPKNVANFKRQFTELGSGIDWNSEINTISPEYYRWNQWLFLKMFEEGLAYKKMSLVNWCPDCQTVISNEQVIDGKCERHGDTDVDKKEMEQWFLKITDFAEDLSSSLDDLDWSDKTKITQKNWIGVKEGCNVNFPISGINDSIEVFTTRIDTLYGATFVAVSCDSDLSGDLISPEQSEQLGDMKRTKAFSRKATEKEGILVDFRVTHPITGEELPIYITNYVEGGYGTGAVMGVPSCDSRDKDFAEKYGIQIKEVYGEDGSVLINSGDLDGLNKDDAISKMSQYLKDNGLGEKTRQYKLRDWCISRQRYWGTPIPIVNCDTCGIVPENEDNLPIELPAVDDYKFSNNGKSPLSMIPDFIDTECPCCGGSAKREVDVMDNFFDSSWYFFRYLSSTNKDKIFDSKRAEKWLPVDAYIGGNEHAVLHLMYTRFITKFLHKKGMISFDEPFKKFFAHGLIIKDGKKMSKSKGNVINPDDYIKKYGADALRMYLMFIGPLEGGGDFTDSGIEGTRRFIEKVSTFVNTEQIQDTEDISIERKQAINSFLSEFENGMDNFKYNVAISKLMEYFNSLRKTQGKIYKQEIEILLKVLSIFCPYISEELWNTGLKNTDSIHTPGGLVKYENIEQEVKMVQLAVQFNGKLRGVLDVDINVEENEVIESIQQDPDIARHLVGKTIKRIIFVKGRIINLLVN